MEMAFMKITGWKIWAILGLMIFNFATVGAADNGNYEITFKIKGLEQGDTCMIAYYMGTKQYIKDTVLAGPGGTAVFKAADGKVDHGLYLFVMPGMTYFEFILTEPKFTLETSRSAPVEDMKVKGSAENAAFFAYLKFLQDKQKVVKDLQAQIEKELDETKKKALSSQVSDIDLEVKNFRASQIQQHKGKFFASLVRASIEPEVPSPPADMPSSQHKIWQLAQFRVEYLNQVDWQDARLLRSPVIQTKIKDYLEKFTVEHPDSIIVSADSLISRASVNDEVFKFAVITITNMYAGTKKMCFDKIYVHMAGQYYVSGRAVWADSTQMAKIKDRYYRMIYNDCDRQALNLKMPDINGNMQELHALNAKYTILVFWAYDCGHCKKEVPQLHEFFKSYRKYGVEAFAVSTKEDLPKWKEFVQEKAIHDWINVADPDNKTQFRILYDVYSTPVIYLLDENKQIIGKRLDMETLKLILDRRLGLSTDTNTPIKTE
jgi:thiol-disulfide isomerase/thioredoxin